MTVCKRVIYTGRVQGVGFRYATQRVAQGFSVTGYVKNLPDSAVELVAEGEANVVQMFLAAVSQRMAGYISEAQESDATLNGFRDFSIRH